MARAPEKPTSATYAALDDAFASFNKELFGGELPPVVFVFVRKAGMRGHYIPAAWRSRADAPGSEAGPTNLADEIALNPDYLRTADTTTVLSTMVHEMVHQLQRVAGSPSRGSYHNEEWARMMDAVGLTPSHTGLPGGKRTGQQMTHHIETGGRFEVAAATLVDKGWSFKWEARPQAARGLPVNVPADIDQDNEGDGDPVERPPSKVRYRCPQCGQNAWAKPDANLMCGDCLQHLIP